MEWWNGMAWHGMEINALLQNIFHIKSWGEKKTKIKKFKLFLMR